MKDIRIKILVTALGLFGIAVIHYLLNVNLLHRDAELIIAVSPIWMIVYASYIMFMIKKFLKL